MSGATNYVIAINATHNMSKYQIVVLGTAPSLLMLVIFYQAALEFIIIAVVL